MDIVAELKQEITAKRKEVENLQTAGNITAALSAADELNTLCDKLKIEQAKEDARFEDFMNSTSYRFIDCDGNEGQHNGKLKEYQAKMPIATSAYGKAFVDGLRHNFKNVGEVLIAGMDSKGGYTVPTELSDAISTALEEENVLRKIGKVIRTASRYELPFVVNVPIAQWVGETQSIVPSDEEFSQITFSAKKLAVSIRASNELLADSNYDLESHFLQEFTKAIGRTEEDTLLNGESDSTIAPTGLLTELKADSDAQVSISMTGSALPTFNGDDILNLIYSLPRAYRKNACFLTADSTLQKIRSLKNQTQDYIWQPSMREGEPDRLFGHPVFVSPYFPAASESGDIVAVFGDFQAGYVIAERQERSFRPLRELYAFNDVSAFLMIERLDAKLVDKHALRYLTLA